MRMTVFLSCAALVVSALAKDAIDYVDPMIGTGSKRADEGNAGGMMPYTGVPFGMWQWVPMTRLSEHGITSFSAYAKDFRGFIATRQPAPWMGDYGQFSLMAQTGDAANCDYATRGVEMVKEQCVFTPYYAKVVTKDGIVSEVTASSRAAILRFTFPKGAKRRLVFDASRFFMSCFAINRPQVGGIRFGSWFSDRRVTAWNPDRCDSLETPDLKNFAARFVLELSEPFVLTGTYVGGAKHGPRARPGQPIPWDDYPKIVQSVGSKEAEGDLVGGWCEFGPGDEPVCVRIGNSFISEAKAKDNLVCEAGKDFDFDALKATAKAAWTKQLEKMRIEASDKVKTIFYTAMYHAMLFPREIDEYGEYYSGFDDAVHAGNVSYTSYSMWDTYRSEHAFLTLAAPERVDGMMRSILQNYREGGWLPKWPSLTYTGQMMGDPASMILAEAYVKGFRGFDVNLAFEAAWKSATVPAENDLGNNWKSRIPWRGYPCVRCGLTRYMEKGWVAADECFESVTRTQDFGLNDLAVAVLAEATGHADEAAYLRKRSRNYRNVWNAEKRLFWPRHASGKWKPFWNGESGHGDYTEAIPETSVWNVSYDLEGLVGLLGGREATVRALDEFYAKHFFNPKRPNFSLHENEPTHHISYIYSRLGEHEKCARTIRRILTETYSTESWGFEGNDDCGQMSSWYILSSLGFYPSLTYTEWYEIGSPIVDRAEIRIGSPFKPATFTIVARNQSAANCLVKSVKLNGIELTDRRIRHSDIVKGGTLEFEMSDKR